MKRFWLLTKLSLGNPREPILVCRRHALERRPARLELVVLRRRGSGSGSAAGAAGGVGAAAGATGSAAASSEA